MTVKGLIKVLQGIKEQDAEVFLTESQYDWHNVLAYCPNPANADEVKEIRV